MIERTLTQLNPLLINMLQKFKYLALFLLCPLISIGQKEEVQFDVEANSKLLGTISTHAKFICSDNIGYFYAVNDDNITKYEENGDSMFTVSTKITGDVHSFDISFALKPLVFYRDQNAAMILDNTLSPQGDLIHFEDYDIFTPTAICNSFNGNTIWVFNQDNFELLQINNERGIQYRSGNLKQQLGDFGEVNEMIEHKNKLYITTAKMGVLIFDIYGSYRSRITQNGLSEVHFSGNSMVAKKDNAYVILKDVEHVIDVVPVPIKSDAKQICMNGKQIHLLKENKIEIRRFK